MPIHRFHWRALEDEVARCGGPERFVVREGGRVLDSDTARIELPLVLGDAPPGGGIGSLLEALPDALGLHLVVLMQAGAVSLALFDEECCLDTKTIKKYTVRGSGRAQEGFRRTRGKSRYGSRLRLRNAETLLAETNAKLEEWIDIYGRPRRLFHAAPIRMWSGLFEERAAPPIAREEDWIRIPMDLPPPTTELALRTYERLCRGVVATAPDHREGERPARP